MPSVAAALLLFAGGLCSAACYDSAPTYSCAKRGTLAKPENFREKAWSRTGSVEECGRLCQQFTIHGDLRCRSIRYNAKSKQCHMYSKPVAKQEFEPKETSPFVFYDFNCFDCLNKCPLPVGKNLLANGGFDQLPDSIAPWLLRVRDKFDPVREGGKNSPRLFQIKFAQHNAILIQFFYSCPNSLYELSFDWRVIYDHPRVPYVSFGLALADMEAPTPPNNPPPNATWNHFTYLAHTFDGAGNYNSNFGGNFSRFAMSADVSSKHTTLQLDNFVIKNLDKPTTDPSKSNLVANGGFETGTLSPWRASGGAKGCTIVNSGYRSKNAFRCSLSGYRIPALSQKLSVSPGKTYVFSFDYKADDNGDPAYCFVKYEWGHLLYFGPGPVRGETQSKWRHYEAALLAKRSNTRLSINIGEFQAGHKCNFTIDNISVIEAASN